MKTAESIADNESGTAAKPAQNRGAPVGNTHAVQHDYSRLREGLERGLSIIPTESPLHAIVAQRRSEIQRDAGGVENLSRLQLDLIEDYIATDILLDSTNAYLIALEHPRVSTRTGRRMAALGIVDRRSHRLRPIVEQRNRLQEVKLKLAQAIGFARQQKPTRPTDATMIEEEIP